MLSSADQKSTMWGSMGADLEMAAPLRHRMRSADPTDELDRPRRCCEAPGSLELASSAVAACSPRPTPKSEKLMRSAITDSFQMRASQRRQQQQQEERWCSAAAMKTLSVVREVVAISTFQRARKKALSTRFSSGSANDTSTHYVRICSSPSTSFAQPAQALR